MSELESIQRRILAFRNERDWAQFHDPKDLAEALSIEAGELLENFLWKTTEQSRNLLPEELKNVKEKLADIFIFRTYLSEEYKIDMLSEVGNLLRERGFESFTQLLNAYHGNLYEHAKRRRVFLSYHAEDQQQIRGFRLMVNNPKVALDIYDEGLQEAINSERSSYIKQRIRPKIEAATVLLCLIGNGTAWREWVDWELNTALEFRKGICGVRLKDSRGRTPSLLKEVGAPIAPWNVQEIITAIECAAARRS